MCGIVGAIAQRDVVPFLVDGLKRLEYRGYDSAGLAVLSDELRRVRRTGRVAEMEGAARSEGLHGVIGIGHTRWATHGGVTEDNAHPHISRGELALVHNGIIENHEAQRDRLKALGYEFESETDTEVIAHLIQHYLDSGDDLLVATQRAVRELTGAYAIAVLSKRDPDRIIAARVGCPLLIGLGEGENFIASDVSAVVSTTRRVIFLEEGDVAEVRRESVRVLDREGRPVTRTIHVSDVSLASLELGPYTHFMQKEIHEQPRAIADSIEPVLAEGFSPALFGPSAEALLDGITGVTILACGTSYYAGLVGRHWIEQLSGLPCTVEIASEYRYRDVVPNPSHLVVTISQSGETLDTMEALKYAVSLGHERTLSICNVQESAIPRASTMVFYTRAGAEIGVASTKAFTTQLAALFTLTLVL
ncbi:MAG: glutamine--fructose-6-phosphate transaminase (isomerizing), partial [Arenimonas sp.]